MSVAITRRSAPLNVLIGIRITIAALAVLTPRFGARLFRMDVEGTPAVAMEQMFGIRTAVLAAGLLRIDTMTTPKAFIGVNVVTDLVDALALAAAGRRREIDPAGAALATGLALTAAALGGADLALRNGRE